MATLTQLVEKVRHRLGGNTTTASSLLQVAIDETALTVQLDTTQGFSRGVAEVGFELVRVSDIDQAARTLTIPPYGRGYKATTAAEHPAGSEVMFNPTWPSAVLADEVNGVINSVYPDIYVVRTHETTFPADRLQGIDLPAGAIGVVSVWVADPARPDDWMQEDRWSFNPDASDVNRPLRVGGRHRPGWPLRVVYASPPGTFDLTDDASLTADFETTTGLPARLEDLLALGVAARLTPFIEVSRLPNAGAEARADGQARPPGQAATTARLLAAEFRARIDQERRVLNKEHPIRVHRTG